MTLFLQELPAHRTRKWCHLRMRSEAEVPPSSTTTTGVQNTPPDLGWRHFWFSHLRLYHPNGGTGNNICRMFRLLWRSQNVLQPSAPPTSGDRGSQTFPKPGLQTSAPTRGGMIEMATCIGSTVAPTCHMVAQHHEHRGELQNGSTCMERFELYPRISELCDYSLCPIFVYFTF